MDSGPVDPGQSCSCPSVTPPSSATGTTATSTTQQGLSRPVAILLTFFTLLIALFIQNPSRTILPKFVQNSRFYSGHRLPIPLSFLSASPSHTQPPTEAAQTEHILSQLTPAQRSSRERTLSEINSDPSTRSRLLQALAALYLYPGRALAGVSRKRKAFSRLERADKILLQKSHVAYLEKIEVVEQRVEWNGKVVTEIFKHACAYYGIAREEVMAFSQAAAGTGSGVKAGGGAGDHTQVSQALKHFVRDFSDEGQQERRRIFGLVKGWLERVEKEFPLVETEDGEGHDSRKKHKILVPGCGVGGLLWEIASLGFDAVGIEWSFYMNIMAHFIGDAGPEPLEWDPELNDDHHQDKPEKKQHVIYPYVDWWSHHATTKNMSRSIHFPHPNSPLPPFSSLLFSSPPSPPTINTPTLHESDFTTLHAPFSPPQYSCIITLFFIDTAQSIPTYIRRIHQYLRPGGIWINLGPLLYGTRPWVELSLEEVISVAEGVGFEFDSRVATAEWMAGEEGAEWKQGGEGGYDSWTDTFGNGKVVGVRAAYNVDWKGLGKNEYLAQGWVARKGMEKGEEK